ncbi:MAG TPA: tyrosine-type recombinase/integrase [Acidimicrobiales bacterium]
MSGFITWLRYTPAGSDGVVLGPGTPAARSPRRANFVLTVVREFFKHEVAVGRISPDVLAALYEVADDRGLPAELRGEGRLHYRAAPRHRLREDHPAPPRVISPAQFVALVEACDHQRDRFLLCLLYFCGLRRSEALGLRRSDIHLLPSAAHLGCNYPFGPHLHVVRRQNVNGAWAKSRRTRTVPVPGLVIRFHDLYTWERSDCPRAHGSDFVFVNLFAEPLGAPMKPVVVNQLLNRIARRAGIATPIGPHVLRHCFGTEAMASGASLDEVQVLMGHASILSTQVYLHPDEGRLHDAVERVAQEVAAIRGTL